jgi:hypothetical protein
MDHRSLRWAIVNAPACSSTPPIVLLALLLVVAFAETAGAAAVLRPARSEPMERYDDPPGIPATSTRATRAMSTITFNGYTSIQVNVNANQQDIIGDAANEPSLAVDPNNHNRMLIGWRQFDTIASNFRQAGFGFSSDGGATWTTGKINPGVFRSDPVLDVDGSEHFVYNSLRQTLHSDVFESSDGTSWGPAVAAFGGDKQWMKIDRGLNNFYQAWSTASNNYKPNTFNKSINDGASFGAPDSIPGSPIWGTLDVALDHTLYLVGWGDSVACNICVERSTDVQNPVLTAPTFAYHDVDLGGMIADGGPNPEGLLGQLWIAVDRSNTSRAGWVYVLASVTTPTDPLDVHFVRSTDNGQTWSVPVRVNDDPIGNRAFQWFGTMSVSPSGRIDAVWNDTRGSTDSTISALFYSFSLDGGTHWSPNVQVTPTWSSKVGWPNQQKIGDYYTMVSDNAGADVAYAATFNGGQDVYYLRIPNTAALAVEPTPRVETRFTNTPNPFTKGTMIRFDAPAAGERARVEVLDIAGRHVATLLDRFVVGGGQGAMWDGRRDGGTAVPAGVYLCRLEMAGRTETHKLLRLK